MPVVMAVEVPTFSLSQISLFLYLSQSENKYLNWYVPFYRHPLASAERISSAAAVPQSAISAWSALPWLWSPLVRLSSGATTTKEVSFVFLSYGRIFCFLRFLEKLQKKKKAYQLCSFFVPRCKKNSFYFYIFVHDHNPFHEIQEHSPQNGICVVQRPQRLIFGLSSDPLHCLLLCIQLIFCVHRRKTVLKLKVWFSSRDISAL